MFMELFARYGWSAAGIVQSGIMLGCCLLVSRERSRSARFLLIVGGVCVSFLLFQHLAWVVAYAARWNITSGSDSRHPVLGFLLSLRPITTIFGLLFGVAMLWFSLRPGPTDRIRELEDELDRAASPDGKPPQHVTVRP